jgi:MoaA/NifB/PqqE/SkfB family radical SAM enzyme
VRFGFNTVAHAANISKLEEIRKIAENLGAYEWQVFEYDTSGPNPTNKKASLQLAEGVFDVVTSQLVSQSTMKIVCKSLQKRTGSYFLIDDSGMAWQPLGEQQRKIIGHITRDRAIVLDALRSHISQR